MQTPQTSPPRHPNPVGGVGLATLGCLRGLPPLGRGMRRTCFIQQTTSSRDRPSAPSTGAKASGHMATQEGNGGRALAREGLCAGGCVAGGAVADPGVTTGSCRGLQTLSSGGGGWKAGSGGLEGPEQERSPFCAAEGKQAPGRWAWRLYLDQAVCTWHDPRMPGPDKEGHLTRPLGFQPGRSPSFSGLGLLFLVTHL